MSEHLYYEYDMMIRTANMLMQKNVLNSWFSISLKNALVESFSIHVRNLIQFFYNDTTDQDDLLAIHYFEDKEQWIGIRGELTSTLKTAKKKANKQISHLTFTRLTNKPGKNWEVEKIAKELIGLMSKFIETTNSDCMSVDYRSALISLSNVNTQEG